MGLLNKLVQGQSNLTALDGTTPVRPNFQLSTLHRDYSIEGVPTAMQVQPRNGVLPQPSQLDWATPPSKYLNRVLLSE